MKKYLQKLKESKKKNILSSIDSRLSNIKEFIFVTQEFSFKRKKEFNSYNNTHAHIPNYKIYFFMNNERNYNKKIYKIKIHFSSK